jgi:hypothetical protein
MGNIRLNNRSIFALLLALTILVAIPAMSVAQRGGGRGGGNRGGGTRAPQRPQPQRGNRANNPQNSGQNQSITITRTDGSSTRYELLSYDVDHLSVRTPGERGDVVPIDVSWNDVVRTSLPNVTYEKVLNQWKALHRADLCPTCLGNRVVLCDICRGTSHDPAELPMDCKTCNGSLLIECKGPKCVAGRIPCTNVNCVKLSDGQWVERDDGKARSYKWAGGVVWVSYKKFAGHEIAIDPKTGNISDKGLCPVCGGATTLECPVCDGLGMVACPTCSNRKVALCPSDCEKGKTICSTCGGTGLRPRVALLPAANRDAFAMLLHLTATPVAADGELMHSISD